MTAAATILVAAEGRADAQAVAAVLESEFGSVALSADPARAVVDFERYRPAVLILAFQSVEQARRYHAGLYGASPLASMAPHRLLLLCRKDEAQQGYALCRREVFDDYVVFWPTPEDAGRLPHAVHRALGELAAAPPPGDFTAQARRAAAMETTLKQALIEGASRLQELGQSLQNATGDIAAVVGGQARKPAPAADGGNDAVPRENEGPSRPFQKLAASVQSLRSWVDSFRPRLAGQLESVHALQALAQRVRPVILVVDDDEYQINLLAQLLPQIPAGASPQLVFATSGAEALAILRKHRPSLVIMDVHLPDLDGVEVTRRIKANEAFADLPVVMITGQSGKEVVIDSLGAGAADFIVKPFDKATLHGKVGRFL